MNKVLVLAVATLMLGVSFAWQAGSASAVAGISTPECPFADNQTADECQITAVWTAGGGGVAAHNFPSGLPGPYAFKKTLHVFGGGTINAAVTGITLNIDGSTESVTGAGGALLLDSTAALIEANDTGADNNVSAGPITITTTGDVVMQAGSQITAINTFGNGDPGPPTVTAGGTIKIDVNVSGTGVGTKFVMCGPTGSQDSRCGGAKGLDGAIIDASNDGATATGGSIIIHVNKPPVGQFLVGGDANGFDGAIVRANSNHGPAGSIDIHAGQKIVVEKGGLVESVAGSGDSSHGGPVSLISGCQVLVQGTVRSVGPDPGADLVHLEGCEVHVDGGQVYSQAPAHKGASGKCADNQPYHATDAGVCVEIWARHVIIDNGGQVWADFALSGGTTGSGWVDIYAEQDIKIVGPAAPAADQFGRYLDPADFAVHSNSYLGDDVGGVITIKAKKDFITMSGLAVSTDAYGNNSNGGKIDVEGRGNVTLDNSILSANGDFFGNPPDTCPYPSQGGGPCGDGGQITVRSWNGALSWKNGSGDARPVTGAAAITLSYCTTVDTTGTTFNNVLNNPAIVPAQVCDANSPFIPAYVVFNPNGDWDKCGESSISGHKFDATGQTPLPTWEIHLYNSVGALIGTDFTDNNGEYSFVVTGGQTYTVCEVLKVIPNFTVTEVLPTALTPGATPCTGAGEAKWGYLVTVNVNGSCCEGEKITGKDFWNSIIRNTVECQKDPVKNVLDPSVGKQYPGNKGPDYIVFVNQGKSVQAAVDAAAGPDDAINKTGDVNGDTYLIILVLAHDDGSLGGSSTQNVLITAKYAKPFALIGCSVTLNDATPTDGNGTIKIASTADSKPIKIAEGALTMSNIFLMDLHGSGSNVAGVEVWGNGRYLRNEYAQGNAGYGFKVTGDYTTFHNGTAGDKGKGNGLDGVYVSGNYNLLGDTNAFANKGAGFNVNGNYNQLLKLDSGDRGKGNLGDGIKVTGTTNTLTEDDAVSNGGIGINLSGTGDKLKNNRSNPGSSGSDQENGGVEYKFANPITNNGGNKKDNANFTLTAAGSYE